MEYIDNSELQLLEVSRGIQKLTQMIDSWSKAPNFNARSKYTSKDLLRESLALKESLITIRRLQETSRMMSFIEQKLEFSFIKERQVEEEDYNIERVVGGRIFSLSTNASSCNHPNEMKSAIRGKLNKQNIMSSFGNHESAFSSRVRELPISSSFSLAKNLTYLTRRSKDPNLIAKLMGLEKMPSQVFPFHKEKNDDKNVKGIEESLNEGEKKKENKDGLIVELSLKKEISCDGFKSNRRKAVKRMDKVSMELFPNVRTKVSVTQKQNRKEPMGLDVNKVNSVPPFQTKRAKEPQAYHDKKLGNAGAQAVCIRSSTSRKSFSITNERTKSNHSTTYLMEKHKKNVEKSFRRSKNIKTASTKYNGVGKRGEPANKTSHCCRSFNTSSLNGFQHKLVEDSKVGYGENTTRLGSKRFYDKTLALKEETWSQKDLQLLLLTSPTFLTKAEENFVSKRSQILRTKPHQNGTFEEFGSRNSQKLFLRCATELMARKSYQLELLKIPIWRTYGQNSELLISLEQLVEDIGNGIKELNSYCRIVDAEDDLHLRLERDLSCKDMFLNSLWDFGWIGLVCVEEFGAVVKQMEELIICGMIGEFAFDLVH